MIVTLLNSSADPNIQDSHGKTPLYLLTEQNAKDLIIAFINHCKFPINWTLSDDLGHKIYEVSTSKEINRLLKTYMNTATSQRYSRETRQHNKIPTRTTSTGTKSRSKSREATSLNKRIYKFNKYTSPSKSPLGPKKPPKEAPNNIQIHQTRNESVKRMFKNFNKTRLKTGSIRKKININGNNKKANKSLSSQDSSHLGRAKKKLSKRVNYEEKKERNLDRLLFGKEEVEGSQKVNKTRCKKGPSKEVKKEQIGVVKELDSSDFSAKEVKNTKIVDYFDNARKISVEEEPSEIVPKIEISLNECYKKDISTPHKSSKQKPTLYSKPLSDSKSVSLNTQNSHSKDPSKLTKETIIKTIANKIAKAGLKSKSQPQNMQDQTGSFSGIIDKVGQEINDI